MDCEINYKTIGERWGIFPRDIGEFRAQVINSKGINESNSRNTIIEKSEKIEIMSCSFTPDEKNKRHRKTVADLAAQLMKTGWEQLPERGREWYSLRFRKITT